MANGEGGNGNGRGVLLGLDLKTIVIIISAGAGIVGQWYVQGNTIGRQGDDIRATELQLQDIETRLRTVESGEAVTSNRVDNLTNSVTDLQRRTP